MNKKWLFQFQFVCANLHRANISLTDMTGEQLKRLSIPKKPKQVPKHPVHNPNEDTVSFRPKIKRFRFQKRKRVMSHTVKSFPTKIIFLFFANILRTCHQRWNDELTLWIFLIFGKKRRVWDRNLQEEFLKIQQVNYMNLSFACWYLRSLRRFRSVS